MVGVLVVIKCSLPPCTLQARSLTLEVALTLLSFIDTSHPRRYESSARNYLHGVRVPLFVIQALDDPVLDRGGGRVDEDDIGDATVCVPAGIWAIKAPKDARLSGLQRRFT